MHNLQCKMHNYKKLKTPLKHISGVFFIIRSNDYSTTLNLFYYNLFQIIINYFITFVFNYVKIILHIYKEVYLFIKQIDFTFTLK